MHMDNAVGSLTQSQRDVIVGSILGDGYVRRIRFLSESVPLLLSMVRGAVIPSMQYELGYNPVETEAPVPKVVV